MSIAPWSFSKIKAFKQCPKQFYHEKVLKQYPVVETEAMRYGTEFHLACEEYIRDGKPLEDRFAYAKPMLESLKAKDGEKICEMKMGLNANLQPCDFFAEDVWWRGIADLVILNGDEAWVIDYKTGKSDRYADKGQLELMAMAMFKYYPDLKKVRAGLLFVIPKSLVKDSYDSAQAPSMWEHWMREFSRMETAFNKDVWNPNPSGLCKRHCPVTECVHNGRN